MLRNSRGNAIIEIVPILAIFILIVNFALGFFGLIHSGILASIGARNYAFETFRNRADLRYLRDVESPSNQKFTYAKTGMRFHVVRSESAKSDLSFTATKRPIKFTEIRGIAEEKGLGERMKIKGIVEGKKASEVGIDEGTNNPWIKTTYGICLTAKCGS